MIEGTKEAGSRRDSLLVGSISGFDTETNLLAIDPKREYIPNETFLRLAEEYGLGLRQD